jgi:hypothetical protein
MLTDFVFDLCLMNLNHTWYVSIIFNIFCLNLDMLKQCLMNLGPPNLHERHICASGPHKQPPVKIGTIFTGGCICGPPA